MNQNYSTVAQRSSSVLATNKVLRNTYLLLSLTLLFSGLTGAFNVLKYATDDLFDFCH